MLEGWLMSFCWGRHRAAVHRHCFGCRLVPVSTQARCGSLTKLRKAVANRSSTVIGSQLLLGLRWAAFSLGL